VGDVVVNSKLSEGKSQRKHLEVDFVCNSGFRRYYIQSALELPTEEKRQQELNSLLNIKDGFRKIIIVGGIAPTYQDENGVLMLNVFDFLLKENSLEA
jgi:predicted AAA+ superfamily ATPase